MEKAIKFFFNFEFQWHVSHSIRLFYFLTNSPKAFLNRAVSSVCSSVWFTKSPQRRTSTTLPPHSHYNPTSERMSSNLSLLLSPHCDSGRRRTGAMLGGGAVSSSGPLMGPSPRAQGSCGVCVPYSSTGIPIPRWPGRPLPHHMQPAPLEGHCSKSTGMKGEKQGCPLHHVEWLPLPSFHHQTKGWCPCFSPFPNPPQSPLSGQPTWLSERSPQAYLWPGLVSTSSLVSDTISHPSFSKLLAGSLPPPLAMPPLLLGHVLCFGSPWWMKILPQPYAQPTAVLSTCDNPGQSRTTAYHAHAGNAGISLLQRIPSAKVLRPPCNGPSNLVRAGRTSSRLTWPPDCLVSDTTIPSLHLATITTPAVNLSFMGPLFFLSPMHQAE